jgi:hypothetical protein
MKLVYILCIVAVFTLSCAKPPLEEMERAEEAVLRARNDANAVQYAGGALQRANDALQRMKNNADYKRYDAARTAALEAIAAAERAIADGREGAGRAGNQSDSLITSLRAEIEETSKNIASARYSQLALDYNDLDRTIVRAHSTADDAEVDQTFGRYDSAMDKARSVRADLADINQKIAGAATARKK